MLVSVMAKNPAPQRAMPVIEPPPLEAALKAVVSPEEQDRIARKHDEFQAKVKREQRRSAALHELAKSLGTRYSADRVGLERFTTYHAAQRPIIDKVRRLVEDLPSFIADGNGLILFGPVGTGKDHLLAGILYAAAEQGISCQWVNGLDFFGMIRDRMREELPEKAIITQLSMPDVLAISDPIPPCRGPTDWNIEVLYRLVDNRYRHRKSTWLTLNVASEKEADELLSAQVFDRLRDGAELLPCFWPSYRSRDKKAG